MISAAQQTLLHSIVTHIHNSVLCGQNLCAWLTQFRRDYKNKNLTGCNSKTCTKLSSSHFYPTINTPLGSNKPWGNRTKDYSDHIWHVFLSNSSFCAALFCPSQPLSCSQSPLSFSFSLPIDTHNTVQQSLELLKQTCLPLSRSFSLSQHTHTTTH